MPVNSTHPVYDEHLPAWQRIRDVLAGDAAIKRAGERYVARLDGQTDDEYAAYVARGYFYNATARTVSGYVGMIFRRDPVLLMPTEAEERKTESGNGKPEGHAASAAMRAAIDRVVNDVDLRGTTLERYAENVVTEVVSVGRAGTLVDWDGESEERAYLSAYAAESIRNWQQTRIEGRLRLSLVVLEESAPAEGEQADPFVVEEVPQLRVLKLVEVAPSPQPSPPMGAREEPLKDCAYQYQVEIWQLLPGAEKKDEKEWSLVRTLTPLRRGKSLSAIPFLFHGTAHSRPDVAKAPIEDIVAANLDHYRLNTDYRHGMHFTALPTAFVTGFDKTAQLRIGSTTAWVTDVLGATASFLEFKGDGLMTFERAMDRVERLLAVLGSRLLESQKRVSESAEALAIRQAGESSIIAGISAAVSASMNEVLRWVYWWHSTEAVPEEVTPAQINYELNSDFEASMMSAAEIQALVSAWQNGAISRDTLLHNFRTGEILPPARTNEQELELIRREPTPVVMKVPSAARAGETGVVSGGM